MRKDFDGWLWTEARLIPRNELTEVVGHDGAGKTSFVLGLMAECSKQTHNGRRETIFLSMAEDAEAITRGRLKAYGADLNRLYVQPNRVDGSPDTTWSFPGDLDKFEAYIRKIKATVAVFDSLDVHLDSLASQPARQTLDELRTVAQRHQVTIIFVGHVNKGGRTFDQAIGGGRGIKAAMRCILVWGERPKTSSELLGALFRDDDDDDDDDDDGDITTHALAVHKSSYGPRFPRYATALYAVEEIPFPEENSELDSLIRFEFVEETKFISPTDIWLAKEKALTAEQGTLNQKDQAKKLIIQFLAGNRDEWMPGIELMQKVMAAGIGERTVAQARSELVKEGQIEWRRQGGSEGVVLWRLKFTIPDTPAGQ